MSVTVEDEVATPPSYDDAKRLARSDREQDRGEPPGDAPLPHPSSAPTMLVTNGRFR